MRHWILTALLFCPPCLAGTALPDTAHVVATGSGKVTVAPDLAEITLIARARHANAAIARQTVERNVNAFLKLAPDFGLSEADITAADLSLSEDVDDDEDTGRHASNGFIASREVTLKLRDLPRLSAVLDAAATTGLTEVEDISFESSRKATLKLEARAKAAANARENAEGLAKSFGASLGKVYSINSVNSRFSDGYGRATILEAVQVTGSRKSEGRYLQPFVDYSEDVTAVFELKP